MSFVQGSAIQKARVDSLEEHIEKIHEAIERHCSEDLLNIVATHADHVLAFNEDKKLLRIGYKLEDDKFVVTSVRQSKAIPVIEDEDVVSFVAKELSEVTGKMMSGKPVTRTQVRELADLVDRNESYWASDIVRLISESTAESDWGNMYNANVEKIRTALYGKIREIESVVPRTRYTKIPADKLESFKSEMSDSLGSIKGIISKQCELCGGCVFPDNCSYLNPVRESLIAEAQTVVGLLGKAEKLSGRFDASKVAHIHDHLADRAKTMAVVASYLNTKAQPKEN